MGRYGGGPKLHYENGWYYFLSLEELPGPIYATYIVRTKDFENWCFGKYNPFLMASNEDFLIDPHAADITDEIREGVKDMFNSNESDPDFCEFNGKVIIDYASARAISSDTAISAKPNTTAPCRKCWRISSIKGICFLNSGNRY